MPTIPDYSHTTIPSATHPFLLTTPRVIARAQARSEDKSLHPEALQALVEATDPLLTKELPPLDITWWDKAKTKTWEEIYPEVFQHTWQEPGSLVKDAQLALKRFLVTGEEAFGEFAKRSMLHLADYPFEAEHYDVGMNYSIWSYQVLDLYDCLFDRLSGEERERMDAFFTRLGRAVLQNDVHWIENDIGGGINNHLAWHKLMIGLLGVFYGREDHVEFALHGSRGILELLDRGLVDDGLWCESSLAYQFAAIPPMVVLAEALRNTGTQPDLFTHTTTNGRTLRQAFEAIIETLLPDGTIPPIGDAYGRRTPLHEITIYRNAVEAYGDPQFQWLVNRDRRPLPARLFSVGDELPGTPPRIASRLFPEHGYAFLRTQKDGDYWGGDGWCAFLTYDRTGVHANQDKLSLMLFGKGKLLLQDVESLATVPHAFSSRVQRELNRSRYSQNTVMIDDRDQQHCPRVLDLVEYRDLPAEKRVTAADRDGLLYPGVHQQRTVCITEDHVLDVFQVVADSTREITWILHGFGSPGDPGGDLRLEPVEWKGNPPAEWLRGFRSEDRDTDWHLAWKEEPVEFSLAMLGAPGTRVVSCEYPSTDEPDAPGIPMLLVERTASAATFIALYRASNGEGLSAPSEFAVEEETAEDFTIRVGETRHRVLRLPAIATGP